jgi:hypothetical protein
MVGRRLKEQIIAIGEDPCTFLSTPPKAHGAEFTECRKPSHVLKQHKQILCLSRLRIQAQGKVFTVTIFYSKKATAQCIFKNVNDIAVGLFVCTASFSLFLFT